MTDLERNHPAAKAWILLGILGLIWGSSFILVKKGLVVFSATETGALRILFASAVLLPVALHRIGTIKKRQWASLFFSNEVHRQQNPQPASCTIR